MATHTPDGRAITFNGPPCALCEEMVVGPITNACGKQYRKFTTLVITHCVTHCHHRS
jgi:hypothetical protein